MVKTTDKQKSADFTSKEGFKTSDSSSHQNDGVDPSAENKDVFMAGDKKMSPLLKAVENCEKEETKELLGDGANLNETDRHGNTVLHIALNAGHYEMARYLMQYMTNCNAANYEGVTPLHIIVESGKELKLTRKFIRYGANVNVADKMGRTPLMLASMRGFTSMVTLLLKHDSDPHLKDINGWTAIGYATIMGYTHIVDLIKKYIDRTLTFENDDELDESSSDEDDFVLKEGTRKSKKPERVIPVKIMRKHHTMTKLFGNEEKQDEIGYPYDAKGNLLPVPEVIAIIQSSANNLTGLKEWILQQQQIAGLKAAKCKKLQENIDSLIQEKEELLRIREELRKSLISLITVLKEAPGKKEKEAMETHLALLREGVSSLEEEHEAICKEVEEINKNLEDEREAQRILISNLEEKMDDLMKQKDTKLEEMKTLETRFHDLIEEMDMKIKVTDEIEENLKFLLRVTYNLLRDNQGEVMKLLNELETQRDLISTAKGNLNTAKEENIKAGKSLDQLESQLAAIKRLLSKIQNQLENHPIVKKLIEAGVIEDTGDGAKKKRKKFEKRQLEEDEMFDPIGIMSLPAYGPTTCFSSVEAARFTWMDASHREKAEMVKRLSEISEASEIPMNLPLEELEVGSEAATDEQSQSMPAQLKAKLDAIMAKHKQEEPLRR